MVLFHLFFLFCTTIQPKIRSLIDLFLLFAGDHSTKIYDPLSFILSLCTTIRPKIRVPTDLFLLFVHDHLTKIYGYLSFILSFVHDHSTKDYASDWFISFICTRSFHENIRSSFIYSFFVHNHSTKFHTTILLVAHDYSTKN